MTTTTPRPRPRQRFTTRNSVRILEHQIQVCVFDWRDIMKGRHPELELLHAIPNGAGLKHTVRRKMDGTKVRYSKEGKRLRREGLTAGIPDVGLPVARGPYHGLYLEHKVSDGKVSDEQDKKMRALVAEGYCVLVSRDAQYSIAVITAYLALGPYRADSAGIEHPTWEGKRKRAPRRGS